MVIYNNYMNITTIDEFFNKINIYNATELDSVKFLLYFHQKFENNYEIDFETIKQELTKYRRGAINFSRLKKNITSNNMFVKGRKKDTFSISRRYFNKIDQECIKLVDIEPEKITENKSIIPNEYYKTKLKYIIKLFQQINCCYENKCYDAAALMMRRLTEVLLILNFQQFGIEDMILVTPSELKYKNLSEIISITKDNAVKLHFDKDMLKILTKVKDLGNYAAHKITYNVHKEAIEEIKTSYQILIQQLLNNANAF